MTHPPYGTHRPVGPGQYPAPPGPYPSAPGPGPMPPVQYPPAGPGGYRPPHPPQLPHPAGPPGHPPQAGPRKSRKGVWFTLAAVLVLVPLLACGGLFGYFGWLQPKQEREHHMRIFESLGVPEGFTVTEPGFADGLETLEVTYYLLCEQRVCPVDPGEKIHKWLTDNRMTNRTIQDVQKCLVDSADDRKAELCVFEWKVQGKVVSAHAMWTVVPGGKVEDRRWILNTEIYTPAD